MGPGWAAAEVLQGSDAGNGHLDEETRLTSGETVLWAKIKSIHERWSLLTPKIIYFGLTLI